MTKAAREHENGRRVSRQRLGSLDAIRIAKQYLLELTGRECEQVSGLSRTEDGLDVMLDMVELERVPRTTDILGSYSIVLDGQGDLLGYERVRRYVRSQADDAGDARGGP
jgi:hypothetical protein